MSTDTDMETVLTRVATSLEVEARVRERLQDIDDAAELDSGDSIDAAAITWLAETGRDVDDQRPICRGRMMTVTPTPAPADTSDMPPNPLTERVTMTEAAKRLGTSKQNLTNLRARHPETFPRPDENVVGCHVYRWLELRHFYETRRDRGQR